MCVSIVTNGYFFPQAGHGVLSDGSVYYDEYGIKAQYNNKNPIMKAKPVNKVKEEIKLKVKMVEEND